MPPLDAHHLRLRLVSDYQTSLGQQSANHFATVAMADNVPNRDALAQMIVRHARQAESFYISAEMMLLAEHARWTMPNETVRPEDLPAPFGFLLLPRPLELLDVRGRVTLVHAILWSTYGTRVTLFLFADRDDQRDETTAHLSTLSFYPQMPKLQVVHVLAIVFGKELPVTLSGQAMHDARQTHGIVIDLSAGPDEIRYAIPEHVTAEERREIMQLVSERRYEPEPVSRFLVAFFRLAQQTLSRTEQVRPDKSLRKRMQRVQMNLLPVSVITLRHMSTGAHEPTEVAWSHRWLRRGHWRQVWCGPRGGERYQRAVWIHPTVCGPPDKPLIIRDHVNALVR